LSGPPAGASALDDGAIVILVGAIETRVGARARNSTGPFSFLQDLRMRRRPLAQRPIAVD